MNRMLSVIIPVYNAEMHIERCLNSVVNQSYQNLEIICVNDGSTDASLEMLRKYAENDCRIRVITQSNAGASMARRAGLVEARGGYITFVDIDDWIDIEYYKTALGALVSNDADIFVANYDFDGVMQGEWDEAALEKGDIYSEYYHSGIHNKLVNKVYRKDMFNDVNFPNGRDIREDACIMAQVLGNANFIIRTKSVYYHYVKTENSIMRKKQYSNKELEGAHRNDYEKIRILWDALPDEHIGLSRDFTTLLERVVFQHKVFNCFGIWDCMRWFVSCHYDELQNNCDDVVCKSLIKAIYEGKNEKQIYKRYAATCLRSGSAYRTLRLLKYWWQK